MAATHASLRHAVRAAEIKLKTIASGFFGAFDDFLPGFFLGVDHDRDNHCMIGKVSLSLGDFFQVDFYGTIANQLYIVQSQMILLPL